MYTSTTRSIETEQGLCSKAVVPTLFNVFLPSLILELLIPPLLHKLFFHSSPITRVYENLIYRYILSRLPFTCHSVAYSSSSYACMDYKRKNGLYCRQ